MLLDREGRFVAKPLNLGISLKDKNQIQVAIQWALVMEFTPEGWVGVEPDLEITGWLYLMKKDGNVNESAFKQLHAAFPMWPDNDPCWLEDNVAALGEAQIGTRFETYNGENKLKVNWLDARDSEGPTLVVRSDDQTRKDLKNLFGAKFRALPKPAAPAPASTPATPAATAAPAAPVATPPKPAKTAAPPASLPTPTCTMDEAWASWSAQGASYGQSLEDTTRLWWEKIAQEFEKTPDQVADITNEQWARIRSMGCPEMVF